MNADTLLDGTPSGIGTPANGTLLGALFESLVTQSVCVYAQSCEARVRHLRTHGGEHEVDLIVVRADGRVLALEVKLSATVGDNNTVHLRWLEGRIGPGLLVWLRRNLGDVWPVECSTLLTPKAEELIANRYRAGSKEQAEEHFESGMAEFMAQVSESQPAGCSGDDLLRLQGDRDQGRGDPHHWLGHVPASCARRGSASQRDLADAHRVG